MVLTGHGGRPFLKWKHGTLTEVTVKDSSYSSSMSSTSRKMSRGDACFFFPSISATCPRTLGRCDGHMPQAMGHQILAGTRAILIGFLVLAKQVLNAVSWNITSFFVVLAHLVPNCLQHPSFRVCSFSTAQLSSITSSSAVFQ